MSVGLCPFAPTPAFDCSALQPSEGMWSKYHQSQVARGLRFYLQAGDDDACCCHDTTTVSQNRLRKKNKWFPFPWLRATNGHMHSHPQERRRRLIFATSLPRQPSSCFLRCVRCCCTTPVYGTGYGSVYQRPCGTLELAPALSISWEVPNPGGVSP